MQFKEFRDVIQRRFTEIKDYPLFQAQVDKGFLWTLYLGSFKPSDDPVFRDKTEHDCAACRSFIKHAGGLVAIIDGKVATL